MRTLSVLAKALDSQVTIEAQAAREQEARPRTRKKRAAERAA
jgi:hypothetical protein